MIDLQNPRCVRRGWWGLRLPGYRQHEPEAALYFPVLLDPGGMFDSVMVVVEGYPLAAALCRHCRQPYLYQTGGRHYRPLWSSFPEFDMSLEDARAAMMKGFAAWRMQNHQHEGPQDDCWICNTDMFDLVAPGYVFGPEHLAPPPPPTSHDPRLR